MAGGLICSRILLAGGIRGVWLGGGVLHDEDSIGLDAGGSVRDNAAFAFGLAFGIERFHGAVAIHSCERVCVVLRAGVTPAVVDVILK